MRIGVIGAGNMAAALVRGLREPVLVSDPVGERAAALAEEVGGEALASNADVSGRADVLVLCHKPGQLEEVAEELGDRTGAVASLLGGTSIADLERAFPDAPVYRFMPNVAAEVGRAVLCYAAGTRAADGPEAEVLALFGRAGLVVPVPEPSMEVATALVGCAPAFHALVAEALVDAAVGHGLAPEEATLMAVGAMAGAAALMDERALDPKELRRRVTSPGGSTARGLAALERSGLRAAFQDAVDAVVGVRPR